MNGPFMHIHAHRTEDEIFEDEVRRIARAIWPSAEFQGSAIALGKERDGVFVTEECIHLVEATTSTKKYKAEKDGEKLCEFANEWARHAGDKVINCYFVTKFEPTAEQREVLKKCKRLIHPISFTQFQQKLINVPDYLTARSTYPFGSARDPSNSSITPNAEYVPTTVLELGKEIAWNLEQIKNSLQTGQRFHLLGDYGAGKSMTLREIYLLLRRDYFRQTSEKFPIYINLRDHQGQSNPAELFLRHATNLGFKHSEHLIRAWRAGYGILILDGFDEVGTLGWSGQWKKLQSLRYRAMEVVRKLNDEAPAGTGIIIAGRAHFFDSEGERRNALGNADPTLIELSLSDFTESQIETYLKRYGINSKIPPWLPRRPLLLGYLASRKLISEVVDSDKPDVNDAATGWDVLIDRISDREAKIEAGIDGLTLRRIVERLATKARLSQSGLGPLSQKDLADAFFEICAYQPDETAMVLLQRLPGLGVHPGSEESRSFIHEDFVDVCRTGDVFRFANDPYSTPIAPLENLEAVCGDVGQDLLTRRFTARDVGRGKIEAAIRIAEQRDRCSALIADLALSSLRMGLPIGEKVYVKNTAFVTLDLSDLPADASWLEFQDCLFSELLVPVEGSAGLPHFAGCYVGQLHGRVSPRDLPSGVFDERCLFQKFEDAANTTNQIMQLSLPTGNKVMLSVLKKLFMQKGAGRRENALYRGLDERAKRIVQEVLHVLKTEGVVFAAKHADNKVWYPVRSESRRAYSILNSPSTCGDALIAKTAQLTS